MFFEKIIKILAKVLKIYLIKAVIFAVVLYPTELGAGFDASNSIDYEYVILVSLSEKKAHLFGEKQRVRIVSYPIAVPRHNPRLPLTGEVTRIEFDPWWYPTEKTRAAYLKKGIELPKIIRPFEQDNRNAMGKAKFIIGFDRPAEPIRIHGTNDPDSIGKKITRGCIRLDNRDILELASIVKDASIKVIINE